MKIAGIKGYDILLIGGAEIPGDNSDKKYNGVTYTLKILNKTSHKELILSQANKICYQIIE